MIKSCLMLFLFSLSFFMLEAQLSYTGSEITVNFSDYTGQGLAPEPAAGQLDSDNWRIIGLSDGDSSWGGTHTTGDFARGQSNADGGATSGGLYSFLNNDAIYIKPTATDLTPGTIVLRIKNETGHALNHVQVDYDILTRNFGDRGQNFEFFWTVGSDPETEETSVYFISPETKSIASPIPVEYVGKSVEFDLSLPDNGTLNL